MSRSSHDQMRLVLVMLRSYQVVTVGTMLGTLVVLLLWGNNNSALNSSVTLLSPVLYIVSLLS